MVKLESKLTATILAKEAYKKFGTEFGTVKAHDTNDYKSKNIGIEFDL